VRKLIVVVPVMALVLAGLLLPGCGGSGDITGKYESEHGHSLILKPDGTFDLYNGLYTGTYESTNGEVEFYNKENPDELFWFLTKEGSQLVDVSQGVKTDVFTKEK
jgi:hypothetical protein